MPDKPSPERPVSRDTQKSQSDSALTIGLVLAGVVAFLVLAGVIIPPQL